MGRTWNMSGYRQKKKKSFPNLYKCDRTDSPTRSFLFLWNLKGFTGVHALPCRQLPRAVTTTPVHRRKLELQEVKCHIHRETEMRTASRFLTHTASFTAAFPGLPPNISTFSLPVPGTRKHIRAQKHILNCEHLDLFLFDSPTWVLRLVVLISNLVIKRASSSLSEPISKLVWFLLRTMQLGWT